jgi:hypothetical protein
MEEGASRDVITMSKRTPFNTTNKFRAHKRWERGDFGTVVDWRSSLIAEATSWGLAKGADH